jgi:hypothetical protein
VRDDLGAALMGWGDSTMGRLYGARAKHPSQRYKVIVQRFGMGGHQRSAVPHYQLRGSALAAVGRNAMPTPKALVSPLSPYLGCRRLTLLAEGGLSAHTLTVARFPSRLPYRIEREQKRETRLVRVLDTSRR